MTYFVLRFNTKIKAISWFAFYSEVKIKEHLKLTNGGIPVVTNLVFFGRFYHPFAGPFPEISHKKIILKLFIRSFWGDYIDGFYIWDIPWYRILVINMAMITYQQTVRIGDKLSRF